MIFPILSMLCVQAVSPFTVCIDPGHPSEVGRGTHGAKVSEIHVAWLLAKRVERILLAQGVRVVLTKRSEEQFVRNRERANIANGCHAALMLRLHCDSSSGTGFTTYYPDQQGSVGGVVGPSKSLLAKEAPVAKRFHRLLAERMPSVLKDNGLKPDTATAVGAGQKALTGSIFSRVPVVLVEVCVLTNPRDESAITSEAVQAGVAKALAEAVLRTVRSR